MGDEPAVSRKVGRIALLFALTTVLTASFPIPTASAALFVGVPLIVVDKWKPTETLWALYDRSLLAACITTAFALGLRWAIRDDFAASFCVSVVVGACISWPAALVIARLRRGWRLGVRALVAAGTAVSMAVTWTAIGMALPGKGPVPPARDAAAADAAVRAPVVRDPDARIAAPPDALSRKRPLATTSTTEVSCDTTALFSRLAEAFHGFILERLHTQISRLVTPTGPCLAPDFGPHTFGEMTVINLKRGSDRIVVVTNSAGETVAAVGALGDQILSLTAREDVVRITHVFKEGSDLYLVELREERCSLVYRHRTNLKSPSLTVDPRLAPSVTMLILAYGQMPKIDAESDDSLRVTFGSVHQITRQYRIAFNAVKDEVKIEGPDADRFQSPLVCSRDLNILDGAPS